MMHMRRHDLRARSGGEHLRVGPVAPHPDPGHDRCSARTSAVPVADYCWIVFSSNRDGGAQNLWRQSSDGTGTPERLKNTAFGAVRP